MLRDAPCARAEELVVEELPDELLVYDQRHKKAHCLNQTAARVWRLCNGRNSLASIAEKLGYDAAVVELAIDELNRAELLNEQAGLARPSSAHLRSRRKLLKQVALVAGAAIALPLIQSIVAPSVAQAASCKTSGQPCSIPVDCSGQGNCCVGLLCCSGSCA